MAADAPNSQPPQTQPKPQGPPNQILRMGWGGYLYAPPTKATCEDYLTLQPKIWYNLVLPLSPTAKEILAQYKKLKRNRGFRGDTTFKRNILDSFLLISLDAQANKLSIYDFVAIISKVRSTPESAKAANDFFDTLIEQNTPTYSQIIWLLENNPLSTLGMGLETRVHLDVLLIKKYFQKMTLTKNNSNISNLTKNEFIHLYLIYKESLLQAKRPIDQEPIQDFIDFQFRSNNQLTEKEIQLLKGL